MKPKANTLIDTTNDDTVEHGMITCPNCKATERCEGCDLNCKCGWIAETRDGLRTHIYYDNKKDKEKVKIKNEPL